MPTSQSWIIEKLQGLGYELSNPEGVCFGMANMAMQAFLMGEFEKFKERIKVIEQLSNEDILAIKNAKIGGPIRTSTGIDLMPLDILGFFDGIELYQFPYNYNFLGLQPNQITRGASEFVFSGKDEQIPTSGANFCGVYRRDELEIYLSELQHHLTGPTSILLNSASHAINLNYDPSKRTWYVIDANLATIEEYILGSRENIISELTEKIVTIFTAADRGLEFPVFNTTLFTSQSDIARLASDYNALQKSSTWQEIHKLTPMRISVHHPESAHLLEVAARENHIDVVETLIASGIDVNRTLDDGSTPLFLASQHGHTTMIKILLVAGADVNKTMNNGVSSLYIAVLNNHEEIVKLLIDAGAVLDKTSEEGITPLFIAAERNHPEIAKSLIEAGADVNKARDNGVTPIMIAIHEGDIQSSVALIKAGADVNKERNDSTTPIMIAAQKGDLKAVQTLLEAGADVNKSNNHGISPIMITALKGELPILAALIEAKANVNKTMNNSSTPIMLAVEKGDLQTLMALIAAGADINKAMNNGATPIMYATQTGNLQVLAALVEAGADINQAMNNGLTPIMIAAQTGNLPVLDALIKAGADVNRQMKDGSTSVMLAAMGGHLNVLELLPINNTPVTRTSAALIVFSQNQSEACQDRMRQFIAKHPENPISVYPADFANIMGHTECAAFYTRLTSAPKERQESINELIIITQNMEKKCRPSETITGRYKQHVNEISLHNDSSLAMMLLEKLRADPLCSIQEIHEHIEKKCTEVGISFADDPISAISNQELKNIFDRLLLGFATTFCSSLSLSSAK